MNKPPGDVFGAWRRMAQQLDQARRQAQRGALRNAGGAGGGGRRGPSPMMALGGAGALLVLGGGAVLVSSAIYNVDGGHRAIKYSRFWGVMPDVYPEGTHLRVSRRFLATNCSPLFDHAYSHFCMHAQLAVQQACDCNSRLA